LGSGKTTLIRRLLAEGNFRGSFIIENEFASENIDKQTLENHEKEERFLDIAGGCICCSSGQELEEGLKQIIAQRWTRPVIIETTGVASSVQLIQKLFLNPLFLDNFELKQNIFLIDPLETEPDQLKGAKKLDALLADLIIINKADLSGKEKIKILENSLRAVTKAPIATTINAAIDSAILWNQKASRVEEAVAENFELLRARGIEDHGVTYAIYEPDRALSKNEVEAALNSFKNSGLVIKRAKGYFTDPAGQWWHLEATRFHQNLRKSEAKQKPVLVFIGENIDGEIINEIFAGRPRNYA